MMSTLLDELAELVMQRREVLLSRWRQQVRELPSARKLDTPTLNDHIPALLEELVVALRAHSEQTIPEALCEGTPPAHGRQRVQDSFDIEEVVAEYNILRGCIHQLADENGVTLQGEPFHIVNLVLDRAIGSALQAYATQRALEVQKRREEYLAFVAHDLRTPLNAISWATRVLELSIADRSSGADVGQILNTLRRNTRYLEVLISKVLEENTNLETEIGIKLEKRECDLWPMVEALIHDLHPVAGTASTRLINRVPEDLVIYADAGLLKRILQNLIANAIKYTPHGEVVIAAEEMLAEGTVDCWVSDTGDGIPPALLEKIFEKGETDLEHKGGMGLGLAIVKTFAEGHGGKVTVESTEGVGSTFRFSLPTKANGKSVASR